MAALFILAWLIHWWWTTYLSVWGLAPQILLVLTVAVACRKSAVQAMGMGFAWGLLWDLLDAHLFGANALALTLIAYACSNLRKQVDVTSLPSQCFLVFAMSLAYFLLRSILGVLFLKSLLWPGWLILLAVPFYNCLVAVGVSLNWGLGARR